MSQSPLTNVVSHWHKLIENFETSPKEFYAAVEQALERRKIPGYETFSVEWGEGGILAPHREYLRVLGGRHSFDMCAAPFGTGFFFSSWVTKKKARFVILYLIGFAVLTMLIAAALQWAHGLVARTMPDGIGGLLFLVGFVWNPLVLVPLSFLIVLWFIAVAARRGNTDPEAAILTVPLVGWFYEKVFAPETYYRIDTMLMFQSAVHSAMMEAIDGQTTQKGVRGLTEDEQKPVFHKLM